MRPLAALGLLPVMFLVACTTPLQQSSSCELTTVPAEAVFGVRDGVDTATYPSQIPGDRTGCQRVWYGERTRPGTMKILATYYFDQGHVRRLVGQVPDGPAYDCLYRDGALDNGGSRNAQLCPAAARVDQLPLSQR